MIFTSLFIPSTGKLKFFWKVQCAHIHWIDYSPQKNMYHHYLNIHQLIYLLIWACIQTFVVFLYYSKAMLCESLCILHLHIAALTVIGHSLIKYVFFNYACALICEDFFSKSLKKSMLVDYHSNKTLFTT